MKLVNEIDDNGLMRRRLMGVVMRHAAIGCGWIIRYTERPRLVKIPAHRWQSWRHFCIWFYRFGLAYRLGRSTR